MDKSKIYPRTGDTQTVYLQSVITRPAIEVGDFTVYNDFVKNPNIIVGDFTYFSDTDFERHVLHHYDFIGDLLVIGKFCQIASGVTFIMNGANHQMNAASTYPFYIIEGWTETPPTKKITNRVSDVIGFGERISPKHA